MSAARPAAGEGGRELRGILLFLATTLLFALMDGFQKHLSRYYPPAEMLWLRYLCSVPVAVAIALPRAGWRGLLRTRQPGLQLARTGIIVTEMLLVIVAFRHLQLADVHAVLAATPLIVAALSVPLLGERVGWRRWAAVGVGFGGILVMLRPGGGVLSLPVLAALAAALLYALYQILTRLAGRTDLAETSIVLQLTLGSLLLALIGPIGFVTPRPDHAWMFAAVAVLGAGGHLAMIRALQLTPAVVLQPFSYALLLWAVGVGWLAFGDLPDRATLLGAGLIVGAGLFAAWRERQAARAPARASTAGGCASSG